MKPMKRIKEKTPVWAGVGTTSWLAVLSVNRIAYPASFDKAGFCETLP